MGVLLQKWKNSDSKNKAKTTAMRKQKQCELVLQTNSSKTNEYQLAKLVELVQKLTPVKPKKYQLAKLVVCRNCRQVESYFELSESRMCLLCRTIALSC